jgi:hypothetical protein
MRENAVSAATRDLTAAVDELHSTLRARMPEPEHGRFFPELHRLPALRIALALCRDASTGDGLAQRFKRVPDEYLDRSEGTVRCVCGETVPQGDLTPCPGCDRWFAGDEGGVWAARVPES